MNETNTAVGLQGVKILLLGDSGTGKTHALRTLVDAGLEVFAIFTEPGMDVVADIPSSRLHWHYVSPSSVSWSEMQDSSKKLNTMAFDALAKMPHINRGSYAEYMRVQGICDNFIDQRTGQKFGSIDNFDTTRVVVFDSFSGLSAMAINLIAGSKPIKSPGDYGTAMDNLERFVVKVTQDLKCHVVLIGHKSRERDEQTGGTSLMLDTLGQKLAPKLTKYFTDIIDAQRSADKFTWSTITPNTVLKARNLPWRDNLPPSFKPIIDVWREKDRLARL